MIDSMRLWIRDYPDVSHHSAILMLADVTVIYEVADFRERNRDEFRLYLARSIAPFEHGAIALAATAGERDIIHTSTGVADRRAFWKNKKLCLVEMEVE